MNNDRLQYEGYSLCFEEHFDGNTLDRSVWNVETHEAGWVNQEWQEYIDSDSVLEQSNSILTIRPIHKGDRYYSGRISTEGKRSFTYGIFEARFRVPKGKGYLPAFWLMSEHEERYGFWPKCGEIDIMEVMGSRTDVSYATIHYGNPHTQSQGSLTLKRDDFSQSFHTVSLLWEEGQMKWYMDGQEFCTISDWFGTDQHDRPVEFPAPFDHEMYLILNLAVGGEWVGDPDDSTDFENEVFEIDYVRVYQKEMKA